MEILENKALLLTVRKPQRILQFIPEAKQVDKHRVVVRWGLEEARVLNNIGIDAPSPILTKYQWPGMHKPMDHQKTTASFLTLNKRSFCFNDQGSGKTGSCIWAADYLMRLGLIKRVLVVCPLSIMDTAWKDDLFNFAMHRTVGLARGTATQRRKVIDTDPEFLVINFDGIGVIEEEIQKKKYDLIIIDEATAYKNPTTTRWKKLRKLIDTDTWLWLLTGTPAAQSPLDAYGLAKLVNPQGVPRTVGGFRDMVMIKVGPFKWVPRKNAVDIVHEVLQPAIRFTKEECMDLPPMTYVKRDVEMTRQQTKYYKELKEKMRMIASGEVVTSANAAVSLNKLLQVSSGAVYTDDGEVLRFDISNRYKVLKEVIDQTDQKVLVFVPFKHAIDMLVERLMQDDITTEYIRGDVSAGKRDRIIRTFQTAHDPRVLVIQPQAAAHGITLTAADTVVWWGPVSSLEHYAQANARVHRKGQHHPCLVVQLQGSAVEKHIYSLLDKRIDVHSQILDLYKQELD